MVGPASARAIGVIVLLMQPVVSELMGVTFAVTVATVVAVEQAVPVRVLSLFDSSAQVARPLVEMVPAVAGLALALSLALRPLGCFA